MKKKYLEEIKRLNHLLKRSSEESDSLSSEVEYFDDEKIFYQFVLDQENHEQCLSTNAK